MKQVEEFNVSPIEQELSFNVWCQKNNIKLFLFDGDDTLWRTVPIFRQQMEKCYDQLTSTGLLNKEEWKNEITKVNDQLFESHGVNPARWNLVVDQISHYGLNQQVQEQVKSTFAQIYQIPPVFIDKTEAGLFFLNKTNTQFGIVTHANREWTARKYDWLNLKRFVDWDNIFIVDENGHKTKQSWQAAMEYFKVKPKNCVVIGDSPRSDINPVCELGVKHCFLVQNSYDVWSVHKQSVNELITRGIKSIGDLKWIGNEIIHRG